MLRVLRVVAQGLLQLKTVNPELTSGATNMRSLTGLRRAGNVGLEAPTYAAAEFTPARSPKLYALTSRTF